MDFQHSNALLPQNAVQMLLFTNFNNKKGVSDIDYVQHKNDFVGGMAF